MTTIQLKRGLSTDWTTNNPVLSAGEIGIETDTNKIKIGDGSTAWTSLSYFEGNSSGGSNITIDTALDSTSLNPVRNSVITNALNGKVDTTSFLPNGYTINLKADGTGDFATIQDAINFLNGKWSNGTVSIELAAGTYNISTPVTIGNTSGTLPFNIACVLITGNNMSDTIINCSDTTNYTSCLTINSGNIAIKNLTLKNTTKTANNRVLIVQNQGEVYLNSVKLQNAEFGFYNSQSNKISIIKSCTIDNCSTGIYSAECSIVNLMRGTLTITNASYGLRVWCSGQINIGYTTKAFTNVTNDTGSTIGAVSADGMILGRWYGT